MTDKNKKRTRGDTPNNAQNKFIVFFFFITNVFSSIDYNRVWQWRFKKYVYVSKCMYWLSSCNIKRYLLLATENSLNIHTRYSDHYLKYLTSTFNFWILFFKHNLLFDVLAKRKNESFAHGTIRLGLLYTGRNRLLCRVRASVLYIYYIFLIFVRGKKNYRKNVLYDIVPLFDQNACCFSRNKLAY